jgi:hypothetical protein
MDMITQLACWRKTELIFALLAGALVLTGWLLKELKQAPSG